MRIKAIAAGAIAALALATLAASAGMTATRRAPGTLMSLVAATTNVTASADRDLVTVATRHTDSEKTTEPSEKPVVAVKPVAPRVLQMTAACRQAINTLIAMHRVDLAEDASERAAQRPLSMTALAADRAEDLAEAQQWRQALAAALAACRPEPIVACQAALASLQALLPANRPEQWIELVRLPNQIDLAALRAALTAVATACGDRI